MLYMPEYEEGSYEYNFLKRISKSTDLAETVKYGLPDDKNFLCSALVFRPEVFKFFPDKYKDDEELVMEAICWNPFMLKFVSYRLRSNEDVVLKALEKSYDGRVFEFASKNLRDDENFVARIVVKYPRSFEFATERLRDDKEYVRDLIPTTYGKITLYVSDRLKKDPDIIKIALRYGIDLKEEFPELYSDEDKEVKDIKGHPKILGLFKRKSRF